ncbi:hypothetical protein lerEdw1_010845 [Lerista edwardsae]|nr:hypothetical protein lerEdw1_010845 [Lerista edwardsae]
MVSVAKVAVTDSGPPSKHFQDAVDLSGDKLVLKSVARSLETEKGSSWMKERQGIFLMTELIQVNSHILLASARILSQVSREEGMNLAREYACPFFETSAALHFYIDDVFHRLVREIRRREKSVPLAEGKLKNKDSLWQKLKGALKKKKESPS